MNPKYVIPAILLAAGAFLFGGGSKRSKTPAGGGPEGGGAPSPGKKPGKDSVYTGGGMKGSGSGSAKAAAMAKLCSDPDNLSAAQQEILRSEVIGPLYKDYFTGTEGSMPETAIMGLATKILQLCGNKTHPLSLTTAKVLVTAVWWKRTGQSGQ